jgi:CheY-like chemotaxis protein
MSPGGKETNGSCYDINVLPVVLNVPYSVSVETGRQPMRSYKVIEVLFPGPRRPVICAIFQEPQRWWLLSELAGRAGVTSASLRRHLAALRDAGLVREKTEDRHFWFRADDDCPIFGELQSIVAKLTSRADGVETILVVEDQPATAQITRILLESWGYRVIETHSAQEALEVFERLGSCIQLLLTDVIMPGLDGPQLATQLRGSVPDLRVVFMSGYGAGQVLPGSAFLPKPFNPASLSRVIRKELDRPASNGWAGAQT